MGLACWGGYVILGPVVCWWHSSTWLGRGGGDPGHAGARAVECPDSRFECTLARDDEDEDEDESPHRWAAVEVTFSTVFALILLGSDIVGFVAGPVDVRLH